jgi:hypothetical protein
MRYLTGWGRSAKVAVLRTASLVAAAWFLGWVKQLHLALGTLGFVLVIAVSFAISFVLFLWSEGWELTKCATE